jgi:hypothetical protein
MRCQAEIVVVVGVVLSVAAPRGVEAQLPPENAILKNCLRSYDAAKTYQGEIEMADLAGPNRPWMLARIKAENDGHGRMARTLMTFVTAINGNWARPLRTEQVIDNGTTAFAVYPEQKQYATDPHRPERLSTLFRGLLASVLRFGGKPSTEVRRINGRPTYMMSFRRARVTGQILIDQATFHLQAIHMDAAKARTRGPAHFAVSHQVFDERIPTETFLWRAPAGFTRTTRPPAGLW